MYDDNDDAKERAIDNNDNDGQGDGDDNERPGRDKTDKDVKASKLYCTVNVECETLKTIYLGFVDNITTMSACLHDAE